MKEDVLEQVVDDYLQSQGYFTRHNVRFRPDPTDDGYDSRQHSVRSDIDVIAVHPSMVGPERVRVVSCKAWQEGFGVTILLKRLRGEAPDAKRPTWRHMRELWDPLWAAAFRRKVLEVTGSEEFHYSFAVTLLKGDPAPWITEPRIQANLANNPFSFLTLEEMWRSMLTGITLTPEGSDIGRLIQLLKAAGLTNVPPATPPATTEAALGTEADA
jgi:hypothetical protein